MPAPEMCTYCGANPAVIAITSDRSYCTKDCMYDDHKAMRRDYLYRRTYNALGGAS